MNTTIMIISALFAIGFVGYCLIKKMDIKITLFGAGIILMYIALAMGNAISMNGFESSGLTLIDPVLALVNQFKATLSSSGLIILILGGYAAFMSKINANSVTINTLTKPLGKIKSAYVLVPIVFLLGNLLSLVIPSASNLAIILLATLYPVLRTAGMSKLSCAAVIATAATVMPTPLGGDNVAMALELSNYPQFAGLTPSQYVFDYHAIISIPTLFLMAIAHYFWQKHCDLKNIKNGVVSDNIDVKVADVADIEGGKLYKICYTILPILPIIILLTTYVFNIDVVISVEVATLISFIIAIFCEIIVKRNAKKVLESTESFFNGMGNSMGIVALLVAASIFVVGLKSIGIITLLQTTMTSLSGTEMGFILPLLLVGITAIIVLISGSGMALFYAMVPLMVPLATAAGISALAVTIPMGLAGNLLRALSPVSAVIIIVAGTTKENPMNIVKRTAIPMILGTVFMFVLSMIIYL